MSKELDIFAQINNCIFDLQSADVQSFERPLKALVKLLRHPTLESVNVELRSGVDLEDFLKTSAASRGGMGGGKLAWPENKKDELAISLMLIEKMASEPDFAIDFGFEYFGTGSSKIIAALRSIVSQLIIPFARDYKTYVFNQGAAEPKLIREKTNKIFIVHGHDGEARETVARFIEKLGFQPIILNEQANRGMTIIEKVIENSDVGFAVVLLTPDDEGRKRGEQIFESRARQNVLLELGYFIAHLGRSNVCALMRGEVNIPSDFAGVVWEKMDSSNGWKQALGRELAAAGYSIDWNKVMV